MQITISNLFYNPPLLVYFSYKFAAGASARYLRICNKAAVFDKGGLLLNSLSPD